MDRFTENGTPSVLRAAYNSYLATSPINGSQNTDVTWETTAENKGRDYRKIRATYQAANNNSLRVTLDVTQLGKPIYLASESPASIANVVVIGVGSNTTKSHGVSNEGENITFEFKTNAKKIYYYTSEDHTDDYGDMQFGTVSSSFVANGSTATNNVDIPNDPGKTGEYSFKFTVPVVANTSVESLSGLVVVKAYNDDDEFCTFIVRLIQEAGEAYLYIGKDGSSSGSITLDWAAGDDTSIPIISNCNWYLVMPAQH